MASVTPIWPNRMSLSLLKERFPSLRKGDQEGELVADCPVVHDGELAATFVARSFDNGWAIAPCELGCMPKDIFDGGRILDQRQMGDDAAPQPPKERNRFVLAHTQLSVEDLTKDPPPLEFVLRPYIPAETVSVLSGPGGSNKTTLTASLAVARALGRRLLANLYPREGETVILTTEDRTSHYRRKFAALREHIGPEFDARAVAQRIHLLDMAGLPVRLIVSDRGEQFRPSHEIEELADALHRVAPNADHVIIETISRITGGVESNAAMSVLVTACERLCVLTGVAVTLVGHVGQNTARAGIADQYAGRGGSALGDNARSSMVLMPLTDANVEKYATGLELSNEDLEHTLVLTQPKRNGTAATESPPRLLRRLSTRFGPVLDDAKYSVAPGASTTAAEPRRRGARGPKPQLTYAQLKEAIANVVRKASSVSGNEVIYTIGGNRTHGLAAISDMLKEGSLKRDADARLVIGTTIGTISGTTRSGVVPGSSLSKEREREDTGTSKPPAPGQEPRNQTSKSEPEPGGLF